MIGFFADQDTERLFVR